MVGSVVQRGPETWAIVLYLGTNGAGKKQQRWVTVKGSREDAERERARQVAAHYAGTLPTGPGRQTVGQFLNRWLAVAVRPRLAAQSVEAYASVAKAWGAQIGARRLDRLSPLDVEEAYATLRGRGLAENTLHLYHIVLRRALNQAVRWGEVGRNVALLIEAPKRARHEIRPPTAAELRAILAAVRGRWLEMPTYLATVTGARRAEVLAAQWADVNFARGTLAIRRSLETTKAGLHFKAPKSGKARVVTLPTSAVAVLRRHKAEQAAQRLAAGAAWQDHDLVIPGPTGAPRNPDRLSVAFTAALRRVGLRVVRFHDLRHAHATMLLEQGVHPKVVAERLGHGSTHVTMEVYSHVTPALQQSAAAAFEAAFDAAAPAAGQAPVTAAADTAAAPIGR